MHELKGMPVVKAIAEKLSGDIDRLKQKGIVPKLTIIRVGEREDDIAYEKGIMKRFSASNAVAETWALPFDVTQDELVQTIETLNADRSVHGILVFRPLPRRLSEDAVKRAIAEGKDVDCMGMGNLAHLFAGDEIGYPPCTAQAVIELLDHYAIDVSGKKAVIVGRSLVVGKPLAMLLLGRNATVTVCHTKTADLAQECRSADILIACAGRAKLITADFVNSGQVVIDVGINMADGKLCGDVDYEDVADNVQAVTPVPGGVGAVTTSVLLKHTIHSALKG